ncbi:hypothetical protein LCGC14_0246350 [marine sediment metagenome]|uniref:Uncharacterized protein n=1 Tax=marine sediment metagenome TaxID=412755 RepID=A0A0F9UAS1_9ZZZZ
MEKDKKTYPARTWEETADVVEKTITEIILAYRDSNIAKIEDLIREFSLRNEVSAQHIKTVMRIDVEPYIGRYVQEAGNNLKW